MKVNAVHSSTRRSFFQKFTERFASCKNKVSFSYFILIHVSDSQIWVFPLRIYWQQKVSFWNSGYLCRMIYIYYSKIINFVKKSFQWKTNRWKVGYPSQDRGTLPLPQAQMCGASGMSLAFTQEDFLLFNAFCMKEVNSWCNIFCFHSWIVNVLVFLS